MIGYGNSMFLATHGILARSASGGGVDPDAQAFITAASITDTTQQSAINQLVVDLKGYGVWTKMKAIYPMVGGTNSQHTWNLKNTAQYQISWQGGVTSSANGVQFNGMNSYGITGYNQTTAGDSVNSAHLSYYSRTNSTGTEIEIGVQQPASNYNILEIRTGSTTYFLQNQSALTSVSDSDSRGFYLGNRQAANDIDGWRNGVKVINGTAASNSLPNINIFIGAMNSLGSPTFYTTKQCAFASIGSGLTDTEAANFYTVVQAFQTTLGRSIGTQTVSDADAQAFVTNAGIVDQVEANAVNNLVIGLKADSLWSKMKAVYPFVGGTSTTNKYNLKNPLDTDAAFRLVFNGGWTFSSNGALPNGTNAYADTKLVPSTVLGANSASIGYYSRTNSAVSGEIAMGVLNGSTGGNGLNLVIRRDTNLNSFRATETGGANGLVNSTSTDSRGLTSGSITSSTSRKLYKNGTLLATNSSNYTWDRASNNVMIGAAYNTGNSLVEFYTNKECAFSYISDGLSDTEAANLYTRIQNMQTALNRNV